MGHERERDGIGPNMAAEAPSQQLLRVLPGGAANSARELLASGVCPRCVLRVHGVFSSQYYAWPDETLHAALSEACGSPTPSISDGDYRGLDALPARVAEALTSCDYEFEVFGLSVSLPARCLVRQAALTAAIKRPDSSVESGFGPAIRILERVSPLPLKDALRQLVGPRLAQQLGRVFSSRADAPFAVGLRFASPGETSADSELAALVRVALPPQRAKGKRKRQRAAADGAVSLQQAELAAARASLRDFAAAGFLPLRACGRATLAVQCSAAPVFVAGRYLKLDRETSQTPWFVDEVGDDDAGRAAAGGAARKPGPLEEAAAENEKVGEEEEDEEEQEQEEAEEAAGGEGKEGEERAPRRPQLTSVSDELCGRLNEALHAQSFSFTAAGREDIDVRMLGDGRFFVAEFVEPRRLVRDTERWLRETEARVNAECEAVQVRALRLARRADYDAVEEGARNKRKVYRCVCVSERPVSSAQVAEINALRDLVIEQKTPLRVLVRRSLLTRRRTVHSFRLEPINARAFLLDIETQAGTYVKELVHGDRGRTTPSVSSLLRCPVDILQLDVLELITQAR